MRPKAIKTEADYEEALAFVSPLFDTPPEKGSQEEADFETVLLLIDAYENEQFPIDAPDPITAIKFRLEQEGKDYKALMGTIGPMNRVYEVMNGTRPISYRMAKQLHQNFDIPAEILLKEPIIKMTATRKGRTPLTGVSSKVALRKKPTKAKPVGKKRA